MYSTLMKFDDFFNCPMKVITSLYTEVDLKPELSAIVCKPAWPIARKPIKRMQIARISVFFII
jgi:hypothetical protein